jgi:hypothetical protein
MRIGAQKYRRRYSTDRVRCHFLYFLIIGSKEKRCSGRMYASGDRWEDLEAAQAKLRAKGWTEYNKEHVH